MKKFKFRLIFTKPKFGPELEGANLLATDWPGRACTSRIRCTYITQCH